MEEFFDAGDVFGRVDAYRIVFDFGYANLPAVFEPAELLELFDALELALGQSRIFEEGLALEHVKSEMF